ncbi:MAG: citrate synthase, partial [Candidatus Rokuibacteriota bacterium]
MSESSGLIRGLEGVVAAETQLCDLDGANGRLAYRGYDIADLARRASFEEVTYLLL